jgi:hypothetical protein
MPVRWLARARASSVFTWAPTPLLKALILITMTLPTTVLDTSPVATLERFIVTVVLPLPRW